MLMIVLLLTPYCAASALDGSILARIALAMSIVIALVFRLNAAIFALRAGLLKAPRAPAFLAIFAIVDKLKCAGFTHRRSPQLAIKGWRGTSFRPDNS